MYIVFTILGVAIIVIALQDLFHTLFHPAAAGDISDWIAHSVWKIVRTLRPQNLSAAGPVAFLLTVFFWAASLIFGFALIYHPRLPEHFAVSPGLDPQNYASFPGAINVSLGALMSLSTGVQAKVLWIQFLTGIEAIFGFGLLTASVSWILSIYPILEHRRSLAHQATLLHFLQTENTKWLDELDDNDLQELLLGFASQLSTHRNELMQFPITYYFYEQDRQTALAGILPYLADIADQNVPRGGGAGLAAATLGGAIDDYLEVIANSFLRCEFKSREQILRLFAEDHKREIVRSPRSKLKAA